MTKTEKIILTALNEAPNKTAAWTALHKASGVTSRGFRAITRRMMDERMIARADLHGSEISLTFHGLRMLRLA